MKTLRTLYLEHQGKVSDKWSLYLDVYERVLAPWRERPLSMVEVGVQNGGSLALWSRYFARGAAFVGCDIDPRCAALTYDDPRISVVVGDASSDAASQAIRARVPACDLFIDDGSHVSKDIIATFCRYFDMVKPGGLYIVEDLHCSYWSAWGGGVALGSSSMSFFKALCDVLNYEHWKDQAAVEALMAPFFPGGHPPGPALFADVFSIAFANSMCIIEKCAAGQSRDLGERIIVGSEALVDAGPLRVRGK